MKVRPAMFAVLFVLASLCRLSAEIPSSVGVVDMVTATVLHPMMSLFDFTRMGFYNVPFGLPPREFNAAVQKAKILPEDQRKLLETEIAELDRQASEARKQHFIMQNKIRDAADGVDTTDSEALLASLSAEIESVAARRPLLKYQLDFPELTSPERTRELLVKIESEVLAAIEKAAVKAKVEVVLNSSTPVNSTSAQERAYRRSFEVLDGNSLPAIETDLYYAFLTESFSENNALRWLDLSRQPDARPFIPLNPHPLVLKGGLNLTPEVVAIILADYKCDSRAIEKLLFLLKSRYAKTP